MARKPYAVEQQKIQREIARLKKRADVLQEKRQAPVISKLVRTMREFGITPDDIAVAFGKKTRAKAATGKATSAKRPATPKYRDPATGNTWTGRGKPPRWIAEAEQTGTSRDQFLILQQQVQDAQPSHNSPAMDERIIPVENEIKSAPDIA